MDLIAVLAGSLQGYGLGLGVLHILASNATSRLMAWLPIPLQELEPQGPNACPGLVLKG